MGSEGAFSYTEVYNLPVYLRRYYIKLLEEVIEKREKEFKKIKGHESPAAIQRPAITRK